MRWWSWLGVILFNRAQRAFCEQKRCWWMRCPQGGFGQVLDQVFRQRGTTSFHDPRGVRIYLWNSLLEFTGSCSLSWANGAAGRAVGQSACLKWTDKNPCWHLRVQYSYNTFINSLYNSVSRLNSLRIWLSWRTVLDSGQREILHHRHTYPPWGSPNLLFSG